MRGLFSGVVWGLILGGFGVAVLSVLSPLAPPPDVARVAPQSSGADQLETGSEPVEPASNDPDIVEAAPVSTVGTSPEADDLSDVSDSDIAPADKPSVGTVESQMPDPTDAADTPGVRPNDTEDETGLATAAAEAPQTPSAETAPPTETDAPARPEVSDQGQGLNQAATQPDVRDEIVTGSDSAPTASAPVPVTDQPVADATPDPSTAPAAAPDEPGPPAQIAALPQAGVGTSSTDTGPTVGKRVVPLTERDKSIAVAAPVAPASGFADDPSLPPLKRYAAPFQNSDNKPLMSIVLIDDDRSIGVEALSEFPYPLTFAVDPTAPDAADKMTRHRSVGFEVVALVDMPNGATAQDAEVVLAASFDTLTQAVGMLEGVGNGVQGSRDVSGQVAAFVKTTGRGVVMQDSGLNTAHKLALRDGVPAALVFRDFDGAGQTPETMRRFLDQAAFRAAQDGGVIMMGRVRPDTISALLLWGLQDRANRVALAPVSAVLTGAAN